MLRLIASSDIKYVVDVRGHIEVGKVPLDLGLVCWIDQTVGGVEGFGGVCARVLMLPGHGFVDTRVVVVTLGLQIVEFWA
ncbi:hypothetical protein [Mycobacterium sp.]|uniref:hypothetical protein n=1 Tax=Mycobacterium sp. TaxID=1785 RepID=UPI003BA8CF3A